MTETITSSNESVYDPAAFNIGVARCCVAFRTAYDQSIARRESKADANWAAKQAFRKNLPPLDSYTNIRDFIACIAYGMLIEVIGDNEGARLLYAAQVAGTIKPPKKTPTPSPLPRARVLLRDKILEKLELKDE